MSMYELVSPPFGIVTGVEIRWCAVRCDIVEVRGSVANKGEPGVCVLVECRMHTPVIMLMV